MLEFKLINGVLKLNSNYDNDTDITYEQKLDLTSMCGYISGSEKPFKYLFNE